MSYQNITGVKIVQAEISTTYVSIYNVPANIRTYVKDIMLCNTTGSAITVNVNLVPAGATVGTSNAILYGYSVAANSFFHWTGTQILNTSDTIQVKASATGVTITISGGEAL